MYRNNNTAVKFLKVSASRIWRGVDNPPLIEIYARLRILSANESESGDLFEIRSHSRTSRKPVERQFRRFCSRSSDPDLSTSVSRVIHHSGTWRPAVETIVTDARDNLAHRSEALAYVWYRCNLLNAVDVCFEGLLLVKFHRRWNLMVCNQWLHGKCEGGSSNVTEFKEDSVHSPLAQFIIVWLDLLDDCVVICMLWTLVCSQIRSG